MNCLVEDCSSVTGTQNCVFLPYSCFGRLGGLWIMWGVVVWALVLTGEAVSVLKLQVSRQKTRHIALLVRVGVFVAGIVEAQVPRENGLNNGYNVSLSLSPSCLLYTSDAADD